MEEKFFINGKKFQLSPRESLILPPFQIGIVFDIKILEPI
jgi:hypothetical protein